MSAMFAAWRRSAIARNTAWMTVGQGGRVVLQATYFVLIARGLGAGEYGAFVAAVAFSALLVPFAGIGAGHILIRAVARDAGSYTRYWSGALRASIIAGTLATLVVAVASPLVLPATIARSLVLSVALSDLVFGTLLVLCGMAYQAHERLARTAQLNIVAAALRLAAAAVFLWGPGVRSAQRWGAFYLGCTVLSTVIALLLTRHELGKASRDYRLTRGELRDGAYFATAQSAQSVYNDIDKTMLSRMSTLEATGIYGAAYRVIEVATVPLRSLGSATYPKFFRHGAQGVRASAAVARQLMPVGLGYGVLAGAALFVTAPVLPHFLGAEYASTADAVRWLALLPLLKAVQWFAADTLTGAGYQYVRTVLQIVVALVNVAINVPLITLYSWRGAAWASLASDGLLAVLLWLAVWRYSTRESRSASAMVAA